MAPTELKRLAASTPVHDARRYALRWAAGEIERLQAIIDCLTQQLAETNAAIKTMIEKRAV